MKTKTVAFYNPTSKILEIYQNDFINRFDVLGELNKNSYVCKHCRTIFNASEAKHISRFVEGDDYECPNCKNIISTSFMQNLWEDVPTMNKLTNLLNDYNVKFNEIIID